MRHACQYVKYADLDDQIYQQSIKKKDFFVNLLKFLPLVRATGSSFKRFSSVRPRFFKLTIFIANPSKPSKMSKNKLPYNVYYLL